MFRFVLAPLFLAQLAMSSVFLRLDNPEPDRWHELRSFGVGGVVEVQVELGQSPELQVKLKTNEGEVLFDLVSDEQGTKVSTTLCEENVESLLSLSGLKRVKVVVELQSEGVFVDLVGVGSVMLPYPDGSWTGNENKAWESVATINRVYIGGQGVKFTYLSGHVLVY